MQFPQYRKLPGFNRFYKIADERNFFECYLLNGKQVTNHIVANQFPEVLRIQDMLEFKWNFEVMDADEINTIFGE